MGKLPEWPDRSKYEGESPYGPAWTTAALADYQGARAEAAIARLRVTLDWLERIEAVATEVGSPAIAAMASLARGVVGPIEQAK